MGRRQARVAAVSGSLLRHLTSRRRRHEPRSAAFRLEDRRDTEAPASAALAGQGSCQAFDCVIIANDCRFLCWQPLPIEREHGRPSDRLLPETQQLLDWVEASTGRPIEIRADPAIRSRGRAIYAVSDPDQSRQLVLYDPLYEQLKDHLIAHECGHIRMFAEAPVRDQVVPVMTVRSRRRAAEELGPDLERLVRKGLPDDAIRRALPIWLSGTVSQLVDTPADSEIERWLWTEWPGLRRVQESSLRDQAKLFRGALSPAVQSVTPTRIWEASNAMNGVLTSGYADLLGDTSLTLAYQRAGFGRRRLEPLVSALAGEFGLRNAQRASRAWAEHFGISDWFEWRSLDEVRGHRVAVE